MESTINYAKEILDIEIEGLKYLKDNLDSNFDTLIAECVKTLDNGGKLVLSGIGKSGYIGAKIAATLSSIGSTAVFLHPVEAMHGDLGMLTDKDLLITLSYSGETEELLVTLPAAKRLNVKIAAITASKESSLGKWSDIIVEMPVPKEACPFNLAPTTTTTALLALGDALAMVLLKVRGFSKNDYGRLHPGGAIGKAVTMKVSDVMRSGDKLVKVKQGTSVKDTLLEMTKRRSGSATIIDDNEKLLGIFTDGDFRRHIEDNLNILEKNIEKVMTPNPSTVKSDDLAVEVLKVIEKKHIDDIPVIDNNEKVVGIIDIQDLPGLKLM